jgi:DNA repair exonuclease SbcCD nuclease subunit
MKTTERLWSKVDMNIEFIHTADIHLGKTYRNSPGGAERYEDFFRCLSGIVSDAVNERVDFVLICGDLFHEGQILPRTFAKTIEVLQPLKNAGIPCIAIEGNHDWIHRRNNISWMEALSEMGYIRLLRPGRSEDGGYRFDPFDEETGTGGHIEINGLNIYGLGYIGSQGGSHVDRICSAVTTQNNLLLFHVGIWKYSPVEIGNMKVEEAFPLAEKFGYVALGHGHKPYVVETPDAKPFAFNPGAPERVNFGEEKYDTGYYFVQVEACIFTPEFRTTKPRPMLVETINLHGSSNADEAITTFKKQALEKFSAINDPRPPLIELKLTGRIGFHPFELGRERLRMVLEEIVTPLHLEIINRLSLSTNSEGKEVVKKSLTEIEHDVLLELIGAHSDYQDKKEELAQLCLSIRDAVLKGDISDDELLGLIKDKE